MSDVIEPELFAVAVTGVMISAITSWYLLPHLNGWILTAGYVLIIILLLLSMVAGARATVFHSETPSGGSD